MAKNKKDIDINSDDEIIKKAKELLESEEKKEEDISLEEEIKTLKGIIEKQNEAIEEYRKINQQLYLRVSKPVKETEEEENEEEKEIERINKKIDEINKPKKEEDN